MLAELGFVDLLVRSGLWNHAPAGLRAREAAHGQSEQPDQPARLRRALEQLGGAFVKLGQVLSVRSDLVPQEYVAELEKLQDEIEPMPFETVRMVVESELECSLEDVFSAFSAQPLGSASLAQVHTAELHDGTEVVVKVQRPEAATLVDLDLDLMTRAAQKLAGTSWAGDLDPVGIVAEFGKALRSELDFTSEARNLDCFGDFFAEDEGVMVPRVYWDYTSSRVLTESRLDGIPLSRPDEIRNSGGDVKLLVRRGVDAYLRMIFVLRQFHSDPHPGNLLALPGDALGFLDFGRVSSLSERALDRSADYLIALAQNDSARVTDVLLEITRAGSGVDSRELRAEIEEMMDRYARADIADTMGQTVLTETMSIMRGHRLHMPSEYAMLFQTFGILQGVVLKLDPQTKLLDVAAPYTLFTVGVFTKDQPFEGWGVVVKPVAFDAKLTAPQTARPGDEIVHHHVHADGEALGVGVRPRARRDRASSGRALVGERRADQRPAACHPRVGAAELLARRVEVDDLLVRMPPGLHGGAEAHRVHQALDQLEVGGVVARHEMEDDVAARAMVQPALVRLDLRQVGGIGGPLVRLAVPQVDDAAVVEHRLPRPVHLGDVVVAMPAHQTEVAFGIGPAAVVLGEPLAHVAAFDDVPAVPEAPQPGGARDRIGLRVELLQLRRVRQVGDILAVQGPRRGAGGGPRARVVARAGRRGLVREELGAGELEQADAGVAAHREVRAERGQP